MATHIAVMGAGRFTEFGPTKLILEYPEWDYTKELLGRTRDTASAPGVIFSLRAPRSILSRNSRHLRGEGVLDG